MDDLRKPKKQLLEELQQERKRSDALYQVSNKLAGADTTDEVLDLIVNEAALLLSTDAAFIRSLQERVLVYGAATKSAEGYIMFVDEP